MVCFVILMWDWKRKCMQIAVTVSNTHKYSSSTHTVFILQTDPFTEKFADGASAVLWECWEKQRPVEVVGLRGAIYLCLTASLTPSEHEGRVEREAEALNTTLGVLPRGLGELPEGAYLNMWEHPEIPHLRDQLFVLCFFDLLYSRTAAAEQLLYWQNIPNYEYWRYI